MKIIRYVNQNQEAVLAAVTAQHDVFDLPFHDFLALINDASANKQSPAELVQNVIKQSLPINEKLDDLRLLVPIEAEEVWASGVTYENSRHARNYEATNGELNALTFYDKVYDAKRPELFFKSTRARTVGTGEAVYLRSDSNWQIPEPELGLVVNKDGEILGYTIGNDMSCRDIEGENPLYLPQAKIWKNSCAIGPAILLAEAVTDPYRLDIICRIYRNEEKVFEGRANTQQLKRKLDELTSFLVRDNDVFDGTVLLTGTSIVPPNEFSLRDGDRIEIEIPPIGVLKNVVKQLPVQDLQGDQQVKTVVQS